MNRMLSHHRCALVFAIATAISGMAQSSLAADGPSGHDPLRRTAAVQVAQRLAPAVVSVQAKKAVRERQFAPQLGRFFQDFASPRYKSKNKTVALGSGVFIDDKHVVTNHHVVAPGESFLVQLADRQEVECTLLGSDARLDLAVLRVNEPVEHASVDIADSTAAWIGETVVAIGNPFGLGHTVTTGVLSALHRTIETPEQIYHDFLQTDASINPGNSGGPLFNLHGQLLGINTAVYQGADGIGFAIPSNRVRRLVADLITYGRVRSIYLGLTVRGMNDERAEELGLPRTEGVEVVDVVDGGPAAAAGLRAGDVIMAVETYPILEAALYGAKLRDFSVGDTLPMQVWRAGHALKVNVTATNVPFSHGQRIAKDAIGLHVQALTPALAKKHRLNRATGVVVTAVDEGGWAAVRHIQPGDVVTAVNGIRVETAADFGAAMATARQVYRVDLQVDRGGRRDTAHIRLPRPKRTRR